MSSSLKPVILGLGSPAQLYLSPLLTGAPLLEYNGLAPKSGGEDLEWWGLAAGHAFALPSTRALLELSWLVVSPLAA